MFAPSWPGLNSCVAGQQWVAGKLCTLQIESQEDQFDLNMVALNVVFLRQDGGPFEEEP